MLRARGTQATARENFRPGESLSLSRNIVGFSGEGAVVHAVFIKTDRYILIISCITSGHLL